MQSSLNLNHCIQVVNRCTRHQRQLTRCAAQWSERTKAGPSFSRLGEGFPLGGCGLRYGWGVFADGWDSIHSCSQRFGCNIVAPCLLDPFGTEWVLAMRFIRGRHSILWMWRVSVCMCVWFVFRGRHNELRDLYFVGRRSILTTFRQEIVAE